MAQIPQQIEDDVRFWLGQDMEHNLFLMLGLVDPQLKDQATRLYAAYQSALSKSDLGSALALVPPSQALKQTALAQTRDHWTGHLYPSFIDHIYREIDWMLVKRSAFTGGLPTQDEICAIDRLNADHAALAAHLLDPAETALVDRAHALNKAAMKATAGCAEAVLPGLLAISKVAAQQAVDLVDVINTQKPGNIIHPLLAAHVDREGKRFLGRLQEMPTPR